MAESGNPPSFRVGHSGAEDWGRALESCLQQLGPGESHAALGLVYFTDYFAESAEAILAELRRRTAVGHWVGAAAMGIGAACTEYHDRPALALMLCDLPEGALRVFSVHARDFHQSMAGHREFFDRSRAPFGLVHGDPSEAHLDGMLSALSTAMGEGFLVGGLTSGRGASLQVADEVVTGGLSGVLFDPRVPAVTRLTQGCSPIGPRHEITRAADTLIVELDGRPALDVLCEELGEGASRDLSRMGGEVFAGLTVTGSDRGDYTVRPLLGMDPLRGLLAVGERVAPGRGLLFCARDAETARTDLRRMADAALRAAGGTARGAVYFSCLGRGEAQFGPDSQELKTLQATLGDLPLLALYCNGEISQQRLYAYTGVLVLFG